MWPDRLIEKLTGRQRDRWTGQKNACRQIGRQMEDKPTDGETDKQRARQMNRLSDRQTDGPIDRQRNRQADKQVARQIDKRTDRQLNRQSHR